eukprot:TRINITY_DN5050_c0_g1_i12.p1 TRINITY_DN5050_c0_g1~~TRINITY_DN5050_c0_g1_i12.p1  ORF type:complete len:1603 (-),score=323.79 TRINITY_DN5050_c0_g1_i12:122-4930(-)
MAAVASKLSKEKPQENAVFRHYVGCDEKSVDLDDLLFRLHKFTMTVCPEKVQDADDLLLGAKQNTFSTLLRMIASSERRVFIFIDGINQMQPSALFPQPLTFSWLPRTTPKNVAVIVSSTIQIPGIQSSLNLGALSNSEIQEIASLYLSKSRKKLEGPQLQYIDGSLSLEVKISRETREIIPLRQIPGPLDPSIYELQQRTKPPGNTAQPLFLRLFLDDIRAFGLYEELNPHICALLLHENVVRLYMEILGSWEDQLVATLDTNDSSVDKMKGREAIRLISCVLYVSDVGLSAEEMKAFLNQQACDIPEEIWLPVFMMMCESLFSVNGRFKHYHQQFRDAVKAKYMREPGYEEKIRFEYAKMNSKLVALDTSEQKEWRPRLRRSSQSSTSLLPTPLSMKSEVLDLPVKNEAPEEPNTFPDIQSLNESKKESTPLVLFNNEFDSRLIPETIAQYHAIKEHKHMVGLMKLESVFFHMMGDFRNRSNFLRYWRDLALYGYDPKSYYEPWLQDLDSLGDLTTSFFIALGEYEPLRDNLQVLIQKEKDFLSDPSVTLVLVEKQAKLAFAYHKLKDNPSAISHYRYCINFLEDCIAKATGDPTAKKVVFKPAYSQYNMAYLHLYLTCLIELAELFIREQLIQDSSKYIELALQILRENETPGNKMFSLINTRCLVANAKVKYLLSCSTDQSTESVAIVMAEAISSITNQSSADDPLLYDCHIMQGQLSLRAGASQYKSGVKSFIEAYRVAATNFGETDYRCHSAIKIIRDFAYPLGDGERTERLESINTILDQEIASMTDPVFQISAYFHLVEDCMRYHRGSREADKYLRLYENTFQSLYASDPVKLAASHTQLGNLFLNLNPPQYERAASALLTAAKKLAEGKEYQAACTQLAESVIEFYNRNQILQGDTLRQYWMSLKPFGTIGNQALEFIDRMIYICFLMKRESHAVSCMHNKIDLLGADKGAQAECWKEMGDVHVKNQNQPNAIISYNQAIQLYKATNAAPMKRLEVYRSLCRALSTVNFSLATSSFEKCISYAETHRLLEPGDLALMMVDFGDACYRRDQYDSGDALFSRAQQLSHRMGSRQRATVYKKIGDAMLFAHKSSHQDFERYYELSVAEMRRAGTSTADDLRELSTSISDVLHMKGHHTTARKYTSQATQALPSSPEPTVRKFTSKGFTPTKASPQAQTTPPRSAFEIISKRNLFPESTSPKTPPKTPPTREELSESAMKIFDEVAKICSHVSREEGFEFCRQVADFHIQSGRYRLAENVYSKALSRYNSSEVHHNIAYLKSQIGLIHFLTGNFDPAIDSLKEAEAIYRSLFPDTNNPDLIACLERLNEVTFARDRTIAQSVKDKQLALIRDQESSKSPSPTLRRSYVRMAKLCLEAGDQKLASEYEKKAMGEIKGQDETLKGEIFLYLAELSLHEMKNSSISKRGASLEKTLQYFTNALESYRQYAAQSPVFSKIYNKIGDAYLLADRYEEAHEQYRLSLQVLTATRSEDTSFGAEAFASLAKYHTKVGNYKMALENYDKAEATYLHSLSDNSIVVAEILLEKCRIFCQVRQYSTARSLLLKAMDQYSRFESARRDMEPRLKSMLTKIDTQMAKSG